MHKFLHFLIKITKNYFRQKFFKYLNYFHENILQLQDIFQILLFYYNKANHYIIYMINYYYHEIPN
jgi:hypothetical protein